MPLTLSRGRKGLHGTGAREDLWGIPLRRGRKALTNSRGDPSHPQPDKYGGFRGNIEILEKTMETAALLGMWVVGKIMVRFWVPYT